MIFFNNLLNQIFIKQGKRQQYKIKCLKSFSRQNNFINKGSILRFYSINLFLLMDQSRLSSREQRLATINHIITFTDNHKHSKMLADRSKKQIEDWLSVEAKVLIDKQEKNQLKQDRLKEMQQKFQTERMKKQREIEEKLVSSEKNKNKNLESIQKKFNQAAKKHQSVFEKAINQKQSELEKQYDSRQQYAKESGRTGSRMSNKSQITAGGSKIRLPKAERSIENEESIDKKIFEINSRLEKAHSMTRQRQAKLLSKIREHNTHQIQAAQEKAAKSIQLQVNEFSHKIGSKLEGADINKQKYDKSVEKKQEEKQKAFSQKLRSYHDNIRHFQDEQQSKLEELNKKFDKNTNTAKFWKDEKGEIYHRKFMANMSLLEQKKIARADQIIQKHLQITNKNKVYKERKHNLFQAIKCDPSS